MKICRFCNHEQESGEYCEACGSPLSTDRVEFADGLGDVTGGFGAFPDPAAQAFPDPTAQSFPDPTISPAGASQEAMPQIQEQPSPIHANEQASQEKPAEEKMHEHVVETPVAAFGTKEKVSGKESQPAGNRPKESDEQGGGPRKIMYSAAAARETVYEKGKSKLSLISTPVETTQAGPGWWNGAPNASANTAVSKENTAAQGTDSAVPTEVNGTQSAVPSAGNVQSATPANNGQVPAYTAPAQGQAAANPQFQPYNGLYNHALISMGLGLMGLLCCCGMTFFSLIFSILAYVRLSALKKGTSAGSPEDVARQAKIMLIIADVLLAIGMVVMIIVFLIS